MTSSTEKTLAETFDLAVQKSVSKWVDSLVPKKLDRLVARMLDDRLENLVINLAGLEQYCDRWNVANSTAVGTGLRELANKVANQLLSKVQETAITDGVVASSKRYYEEQVDYNLKRLIRERASADAESLFEAWIQESAKKYLQEVGLGEVKRQEL